MRTWIVVALIAGGCGDTASGSGGSTLATTTTTTTAAGSAAAPTPAPVRLDREPVQLGGVTTWAGARGLLALRFCPGDRELVALDELGFVHRYRADDGRELSAVSIGLQEEARAYQIDCRADGAVLAIGAASSPVLVDAKGNVRKPPRELRAETVRFADDGTVRMLVAAEGAFTWNDETQEVTETFKIPERTLYGGLGDGGVFVGYVFDEDRAERSYTWMHRDDGELRLPGRLHLVDEIAVAPDGAVVVRDYMVATAWTLTRKKPSKQHLLLDQSGTHVKAVAASNRWMVAVGADSVIRVFARPSLREQKRIRPCKEYGTLINVAISRDDTRLAAICQDRGIRVFSLDGATPAAAEPPSSAALTLAWSPGGARLATRSADGTIRVWRGAELETKIDADSGTTLGWRSETELAGDRGLQGWRWQLPDGRGEEFELPPRSNWPVFGRGGAFAMMVSRSRTAAPDEVKIVSAGGKEQVFEVPAQDDADKLLAFELGADGRRAVMLRGPHRAGSAATQLIDLALEAGGARAVQLSATAVALAGDDIIVASSSAGLLLRAHRTGAIGQHGAKVTALAAAGAVIAAGGEDGAITLWSGSRMLGRLAGHRGPVRALAFSPDGLRLASAGDDATRVWDLRP